MAAAKKGGVISRVLPDSPAQKAGILAGDILLAIDQVPLSDVLDYWFLSAEEKLTLKILRGEKPLAFKLKKKPEESLGLDFSSELFDRIKSCPAKCIFCFMDQNPKGLRKSLYLKDDDYRLSFLHGNYITLLNLKKADFDRIKQYRLSPLYISVQATSPPVREKMFGTPLSREILPKLSFLAKAKIFMHIQLVVCPGINDGGVLEQSIAELSAFYPYLSSIALVPVGLTRHRKGLFALKPVNKEKACEILAQVGEWQAKFKRQFNRRLVFPADEFFLRAGEPFPPYSYYEGFPQLQDGVGLARWFITGFKRLSHLLPSELAAKQKVAIITGELGGRVLAEILPYFKKVKNLELKIIPLKNKFLGPQVSVAGLLAGRDILEAVQAEKSARLFLLPEVCLREGSLFLDELSLEELRAKTAKEIKVVKIRPAELLKAVLKKG